MSSQSLPRCRFFFSGCHVAVLAKGTFVHFSSAMQSLLYIISELFCAVNVPFTCADLYALLLIVVGT